MTMPETFGCFHVSVQTEENSFQEKAFRSSCTLQPEAINVQVRMELWTGRVGCAVSIEETPHHPSNFLTCFSTRLSAKALICH